MNISGTSSYSYRHEFLKVVIHAEIVNSMVPEGEVYSFRK
jgi:hypothetical protein